MLSRIIKAVILTAMVLISTGCGQQETFYAECSTSDGHFYKIQPGGINCPYSDSTGVPVDQRLGY